MADCRKWTRCPLRADDRRSADRRCRFPARLMSGVGVLSALAGTAAFTGASRPGAGRGPGRRVRPGGAPGSPYDVRDERRPALRRPPAGRRPVACRADEPVRQGAGHVHGPPCLALAAAQAGHLAGPSAPRQRRLGRDGGPGRRAHRPRGLVAPAVPRGDGRLLVQPFQHHLPELERLGLAAPLRPGRDPEETRSAGSRTC